MTYSLGTSQSCCLSLDMFQHLNVLLLVRGPELETGLKIHQCPIHRDHPSPAPAGHTTVDLSQDVTGLLGHLHTDWLIFCTPRSLSSRQISSHSSPSMECCRGGCDSCVASCTLPCCTSHHWPRFTDPVYPEPSCTPADQHSCPALCSLQTG